jgi:Sulfotransferase domain
MRAQRSPVLVTGLPRSGTSWVGKMVEAGGQHVYVNEPLNPSHPPGRSPGVLDADVEHYFQYICADNEDAWLRPFRRTVGLRYGLVRELRRNHTPYDLGRAGKYAAAFASGRLRGRAALLDDPYALLSVAWLVDNLDVRAVVLVRDPVAFVGSWTSLGWSVDPAELLAQPLLMRDHLEPFRDELTAAAGTADPIATACLLWRAAYSVVHTVAAGRPGIAVFRHEDLAADPQRYFCDLYHHVGMDWTPAVAETVRAATSSSGERTRAFSWSVRGGMSRTAFQRMDSRAALGSFRKRLSQEQIDRVLLLTADVRDLYYAASPA